ncbi:hypothetical protein [Brevibacillus borstelensis]|uniref:hypothetical protein n=1 Tax=Brevibacillus borstelensis TaxID=45462 RepID=UPI0030C562ED
MRVQVILQCTESGDRNYSNCRLKAHGFHRGMKDGFARTSLHGMGRANLIWYNQDMLFEPSSKRR